MGLTADLQTKDGFSYYGAGNNVVGYSPPQVGSKLFPIGLAGVAANDAGADNLLDGMDKLRGFVYSTPQRLFDNLRGTDSKGNLKASRALHGEFSRLFKGRYFYVIYFLGGKNGGEEQVYEIPAAVVMASGHNPDAFTQDIILYLQGRPAIAVSKERGKEGSTIITDRKEIDEVRRFLEDGVGALSTLRIRVTGNENGLIIPASGLQPRDLEEIVGNP